MRLLDTETGQFVDRDPEKTEYAILSHTWDQVHGEQTFKQLRKIQNRCVPPTPHYRAPNYRLSDSDRVLLASYEPDDALAAMPLPFPPPPRSPPATLLVAPLAPTPAPNNRARLFDVVDVLRWMDPSGVPLTYHHKDFSFGGWRLPILAHLLECTGRLFMSFVMVLLSHLIIEYTLTSTHHTGPSATSSEPVLVAASAAHVSLNPEASLERQPSIPLHPIWGDLELSPKIREASAVARARGYRYLWIDSCCIDKSSSVELSEAINSMYYWYACAAICYAYLADVPAEEDHWRDGSRFRASRWFTRGWTLQELIAPLQVDFLSMDWTDIGSKHTLVDLVESITAVDYKALLHQESLDMFSVSQRLSWASKRETTRVEDRAYSLLGIFDINMPTLYGEGDRAFRRLQEEIMQRIPDQSLFAWGCPVDLDPRILFPKSSITTTGQLRPGPQFFVYGELNDTPFSPSPVAFEKCGRIVAASQDTIRNLQFQFKAPYAYEIEYTSTPYGIRTQFQIIPLSELFPAGSVQFATEEIGRFQWYLIILRCEHKDRPGHILGRVCYILPSDSGIQTLSPGHVMIYPAGTHMDHDSAIRADLFALAPEILECCRPHIAPTVVYISHPNRTSTSHIAHSRPYKTVKLLIVRETCDALRARGYTVNLQSPDPAGDHSTTHRLELAHKSHNIAVEFRHVLRDDGKRFTIDAELNISGPSSLNASVNSNQACGTAVTASWTDAISWYAGLKHERVQFVAPGGQTHIVDLSLDFAGAGAYLLRIDIRGILPDISSGSSLLSLPSESPLRPSGRVEERSQSTHDTGPTHDTQLYTTPRAPRSRERQLMPLPRGFILA